ncbi:MAG: YvcK family protein [Selenomonadaceae bacterium]|nr:YvcK family protein [Selenomonadaceae bacterium]
MLNLLKWLYPGMKMKRWLLVFAIGVLLVSFGAALALNYEYLGRAEEEIFRFVYMTVGSYNYQFTMAAGVVIVIIGACLMMFSTRSIIRSIIAVLIPDRSEKIVNLIYQKQKLSRGPVVTVIGGGHGLSVLLRGIKESTSNVSAVVTVADDGGSSGRLREELGIIPPGDLRNCLVALADTEPLMEKLFQYRFKGSTALAGHSFGNLFIAAMNEVTGDMETALKESSKVLAVKGRVIPASKVSVRLDAIMTDGTVVEGESQIPEAHKKIRRVQLFPKKVPAVPAAIEAIENSDAIILGPGSLYTSIMPNLLVEGVAKALKKSKAIKIYICNVMTQPGETDNYSASAHAKAILDHTGRGAIDYVLVNSAPIPKNFCEESGSQPVEVDEEKINALGCGLIKADLISETDSGRHDPDKLCKAVMKIIYEMSGNFGA